MVQSVADAGTLLRRTVVRRRRRAASAGTGSTLRAAVRRTASLALLLSRIGSRMNSLRLAAALLAASTLLGLPGVSAAQTAGTPQSPPLPGKTIGVPQQPQIVPSMIVLNARGAKLAGQKL